MIAPRPSARTPGRDLSPIAQRRQQMTDSPIARLYLGCPPWRSNAQEGTAYIHTDPVYRIACGRPPQNSCGREFFCDGWRCRTFVERQCGRARVTGAVSPEPRGNIGSRDAAQAALEACSNGRRHALSGPRMLQRRTDGLWGGGYRAAAAPKNAWTAAPGPPAPCRDRA
jgi:hypothetical protein